MFFLFTRGHSCGSLFRPSPQSPSPHPSACLQSCLGSRARACSASASRRSSHALFSRPWTQSLSISLLALHPPQRQTAIRRRRRREGEQTCLSGSIFANPPDAFPPIDAISLTSSLGLFAKLPGLPWPGRSCLRAACAAFPPFEAISRTSSVGRLAKLAGLLECDMV
jgi:hypothetical protein